MHQGEELKRIRRKRRIKIKVIAEALGIIPSSLHYVEATKTLQFETLKKYCKVLDIPIAHFHPDVKEDGLNIREGEGEYDAVPHLGKRISELRKQKRINVSDFAKALGYSNRQSVYSMEKRKEIDFDIVKKVSKVLDVPLEELLGKNLLDTLNIQTQDEAPNELLEEKNKEIMTLKEKIIELQDEVIKLNKLLNIRKSD